jgi:DNA-binding CsgD family transcriptional regulator
MDTPNIPHCLIPDISEIEFYEYQDAIICFKGGNRRDFFIAEDITEDIFNEIMDYLVKNPLYRNGLAAMGCKNEHEEVFQFIKCKLVNNDNKSDIDGQGNVNEEFVDCPFRGHCSGERFICKQNAENLSKRELQIIGLVRQDLADKQIAYKLGTATVTVRNQINKINRKLGTWSKMGIVRFAVQNNIV